MSEYPAGNNTIALDFDGTLYPFVGVHDEPPPNPGAVEAARRLKDAGFHIVIYTSRLSADWLEASGFSWAREANYIRKLLTRDGIPFDDITGEKVRALWYVDDRAIRYADNWADIANLILFSQGRGICVSD